MNILHICCSAITDKFYTIFFDKLKRSVLSQAALIIYDSKSFDENIKKNVEERFSHADVKLLISSLKNNSDRILYHKKINKYYKYLKGKSSITKYDVIHAHSLYTDGGIAYRAFKDFGVPYIVAVRSTDTELFMKYFKHLASYARKILESASAVVYITPQLREKTERILYKHHRVDEIAKKSCVIPNGVDSYWLENQNEKRKNKLENQQIKLIQVSRLIPLKNTDKTIEAVRLLKNEGVDCELTIVGDGPEKDRLKVLISKYELNENVRMLGMLTDKKSILDEYRKGHIFVMPSVGETFGISYIEAMTQGLPIIGVKRSGVDGFFEEPVGVFVEKPDAEALVEAIKTIISNYDIYSRNCTSECRKYDWNEIIKKYLTIYHL